MNIKPLYRSLEMNNVDKQRHLLVMNHLEGFDDHLEVLMIISRVLMIISRGFWWSSREGFDDHLEGFDDHLEGFDDHLEGFDDHLACLLIFALLVCIKRVDLEQLVFIRCSLVSGSPPLIMNTAAHSLQLQQKSVPPSRFHANRYLATELKKPFTSSHLWLTVFVLHSLQNVIKYD